MHFAKKQLVVFAVIISIAGLTFSPIKDEKENGGRF